MIGRQQYARQVRSFPECCCFVADQFRHLLFVCFDGGTEGEDCRFSNVFCFDSGGNKMLPRDVDGPKQDVVFYVLCVSATNQQPPSGSQNVPSLYLNVLRSFRTSHHPCPKGWTVRRHRHKIVDRLHLFRKLNIAVPFAMLVLWPTVRDRGFARWSAMPHARGHGSATNPDQWSPNPFCVWPGGPARGDVQDVSIHSSFQWVCRSVLARFREHPVCHLQCRVDGMHSQIRIP